jgi:hypothetical protein
MADRTDSLEECQAELDALVEENLHLRASANAFADLAERLKASLDRERYLNPRSSFLEHREPREGDDPADEKLGR